MKHKDAIWSGFYWQPRKSGNHLEIHDPLCKYSTDFIEALSVCTMLYMNCYQLLKNDNFQWK